MKKNQFNKKGSSIVISYITGKWNGHIMGQMVSLYVEPDANKGSDHTAPPCPAATPFGPLPFTPAQPSSLLSTGVSLSRYWHSVYVICQLLGKVLRRTAMEKSRA